jgi:hypothetical protein
VAAAHYVAEETGDVVADKRGDGLHVPHYLFPDPVAAAAVVVVVVVVVVDDEGDDDDDDDDDDEYYDDCADALRGY